MQVAAPLLLLVAYVLLDAYSQGLLNRLTRRYVPPVEQPTVNRALHVLYPACYCILIGVVALKWGLQWVSIGLLVRVALFDAVLNRTVGAHAFAVGQSAFLDKLLRRLSPASQGEAASMGLRALALAGIVTLLCLFL
jgi:hypothetical protein